MKRGAKALFIVLLSAFHSLRLSAASGDLAWSFPTGGALTGSPSVGADGSVFFCSSEGKLYAVDTNGLAKWTFNFGGGSGTTPAIGADGVVYFGGAISRYPDPVTNALFAVDATGQLRWRIVVGTAPISGFAIGADGTLYTALGSPFYTELPGQVLALNPAGSNLWSFANGRSFTATPVIGADGTIYAGSGEGWLDALRPDGTQLWGCNANDASLKPPVVGTNGVLFVAGADFHAINPDGQVLWSASLGAGADSGPSCIDSQGLIYSQGNYTYYTLSSTSNTGFTLPNPQDHMISNLARDSNGTLYLPIYSGIYSDSLTGKIYALAGPGGAVQWEFDLFRVTFGTPALGANLLYVPASDGKLYALRTGAGPDTTAWPQLLHDAQHTARATQLPPAPLPPIGVSATFGSLVTEVRVSWAPSGGASVYDIFRASTTNLADATLLGSQTGQGFFEDKTAVPETAYTYWVKARNAAGTSDFSLPATGKRRLAVPGDLLYQWTLSGSIDGSAAIGADGTIYVTAHAILYALRADGTIAWQYSRSGASMSSPTLSPNGTIYVGVQTSLNTSPAPSPLVAVNPDGSRRWEFQAPDNIRSTPALGADGNVYFTTYDIGSSSIGSLYAVSPNGQLIWSLNLGSGADASVAVGRDGTLYVFTLDGYLHAVRPDGVEIWKVKAGTQGGGDTLRASLAFGTDGTIYVSAGALNGFWPDGTRRWQSTLATFYSSPVVGPNSILLASAQDGYAYAFQSDTNAWRHLMSAVYRGAGAFTSDGNIYVTGANGSLYTLSQAGAVLRQTSFGSLWGSGPTIAPDGTVYVGATDGIFRSIAGTGGLADAPWPMFQHDVRHSGRDSHTAVAPSMCSALTATDGTYSDRVRVSWLSETNARCYEVWRNSINNVNAAIRVADTVGGQTFYDDQSAIYGTTNFYWVRAVNGVGSGPFSLPDTGFLRAPLVARDVPAATRRNLALTLSTSTLLAYASNSLPYPMTVSAVATTSTNGAGVSKFGNTISYSPRSGFLGVDRFGFTITDTNGGSGSANVMVTVWSDAQGSAYMLPLVASGVGACQISFAGVPGRTYGLQRGSSVTGPWTEIASLTVPSTGVASFVDSGPPDSAAFYRATYP